MKLPRFSSRPQSGFSLVELMVALAVGMIVVLVVAQFFVATRGTYLQSDAVGRLTENGRFAIDALASEVRMAGYSGCAGLGMEGDGAARIDVNNIALPQDNDFFKFKYTVRGYVYGGSSLPPTLTSWSAVKPGTSVLLMQRADNTAARLTGNLEPDNANIQIADNAAGIVEDEILMITDCSKADVFRVNSVSGGAGSVTLTHSAAVNTQPHLSDVYTQDSTQLMRLVSTMFYVGSGSGSCPADTLCRVNNTVQGGSPSTRTQSLVAGVEDLDLLYGIDTGTTPDGVVERYLTANDVTSAQWGRVVSVQINMLLRSESDRVTTRDNTPYWYNGSLVTPTSNDRYMRRSYSQLVTLRNRTP